MWVPFSCMLSSALEATTGPCLPVRGAPWAPGWALLAPEPQRLASALAGHESTADICLAAPGKRLAMGTGAFQSVWVRKDRHMLQEESIVFGPFRFGLTTARLWREEQAIPLRGTRCVWVLRGGMACGTKHPWHNRS